jgi:hypothetical protein
LPACADGPGDPSREPPGQPGTADTSGETDASAGDDAALDDDGGESSSDGAGDSGGDAPEEMPCGDLCLADAPNGWHGPAALIRSGAADEPPTCGGSHPTELASMMSDLIAPAAVCDCHCGEATDVACDTAIASLYSDLACEDFVDSFVFTTSCSNLLEGSGYWSVEFTASGGACDALPSFSVADVEFTRWTLCGAQSSAGACEYGETCTATPSAEFEESQCIWMAGDVACPGAHYTDRTLVFGALADDRDCGECSCAAPVGACDDGLAAMSLIPGCDGSGIALWEASPGDCFGEIPIESAHVLVPATPFASCDPTMPESLGGASLDEPFTLCCEAR